MSAQLAGERAEAQEAAPPAPPRRRRLTSRQRNAIRLRDHRARVPDAAARLAAQPGPADGRGLHARLPRAGAARRLSQPRLPPPLRARAACGCWPAVFKVFGTSLTAERLSALLQQIGVVVRRLRAWPAVGPRPWRSRARSIVARDHRPADRAHRARLGRRRRARPPRPRRRARSPADRRPEDAPAGYAARSAGCCRLSRCCTGST